MDLNGSDTIADGIQQRRIPFLKDNLTYDCTFYIYSSINRVLCRKKNSNPETLRVITNTSSEVVGS